MFHRVINPSTGVYDMCSIGELGDQSPSRLIRGKTENEDINNPTCQTVTHPLAPIDTK